MFDDKEKKCGLGCWSRSGIAGAVFIILATLLTVLTLNGFGILGMFLVGCMLCHRKSHCGCPCHMTCSEKECDNEKCETEVTTKTTKSAPKKEIL